MYSAALLFIWAAILSHLSVLNLAIGVSVTSVVVIRVVTEERLLRARYPEYRDYAVDESPRAFCHLGATKNR